MPYIGVNTSKTLSDCQKDRLKAALGEKLPIIPGKTEAVLMVDISDGRTMYFGGEKKDLAFVDIRCFRNAEPQYRRQFTEEVFHIMEEILGLPNTSVYVNYSELATWGSKGTLRD